jgi:hypothetical protein
VRQIPLIARPVQLRPAPLRPVARKRARFVREHNNEHHDQSEQKVLTTHDFLLN